MNDSQDETLTEPGTDTATTSAEALAASPTTPDSEQAQAHAAEREAELELEIGQRAIELFGGAPLFGENLEGTPQPKVDPQRDALVRCETCRGTGAVSGPGGEGTECCLACVRGWQLRPDLTPREESAVLREQLAAATLENTELRVEIERLKHEHGASMSVLRSEVAAVRAERDLRPDITAADAAGYLRVLNGAYDNTWGEALKARTRVEAALTTHGKKAQ